MLHSYQLRVHEIAFDGDDLIIIAMCYIMIKIILSRIRAYISDEQALTINKTKVLPYFDNADINFIGTYKKKLKSCKHNKIQPFVIAL